MVLTKEKGSDEIKRLLKTLNKKQSHYINLKLKNPEKGEYLLTVFHMVPRGKLNFLQAATEIAAESSTGTNFPVKTETNFARNLNALVYEIDLRKNLVKIAYPIRIFDRGGNIQNIFTFIAGNIYGMKEVSALKLLDVWFPKEMLSNYDGPSYTLDDMRKYLGAYNRPILGTIIKPKIGLKAYEYAKICYDFWRGGGDFVKNDEPQANQDFCPFDKMVGYVKEAMNRAVRETGKKKVHSFNISSPDFNEMIRRCEVIKKAGFEKGSYAFLIDGITAGWMAVQTLRRLYPDVFIHFHRAGHGAYTREENPFGFSVLVLSKFARLAGASGVHTGTAGIGKMSGNKHEDIVAAKNILEEKSEGHFFTQDWTISKNRKIEKCVPIVSGGLNPLLLESFIESMKGVDFITTMGAGVHAHPRGTRSGATSLVQSAEAYQKNIGIHEYAKTHKELNEAIKFFEKNKVVTV